MSDWSTLSPPGISAKQCQKLVDKYFQQDEPLAGRPVMIPFTKQAFVMGELQPAVTTKTSANGSKIEHVQVRPGKDKALQTLSIGDAKQWFLKKAQPSTPINGTPSTSSVHEKPATSPTSTMDKSESKSPNHTTSAASSTSGSKKAVPQNQTQKSAPTSTILPFHPAMVEIHEEFNEDGTQTKGDVVNVTSEFQALMQKIGQGDAAMKFPQDGGGETKEEEPLPGDDGSDGDDDSEIIMITDDDTPLKQLTDPEYDQLAKRLDELARLEETENERLQQGARLGKLKAKRAAAATNNKKKSSGGGWNKGFLNQKPKKKTSAKKKASTASVVQPTVSTVNQNESLEAESSVSANNKSQVPSPTVAATEASITQQATTGGVAFDLSQNKVQEIPSLPGTRPIPPRNNNNVGSVPIRPVAAETPTARMMDSSVFSGVIQERPTAASAVGEQVNATNNSNKEASNNNGIQERSAPPQAFRRRRQQQQRQQQQQQQTSQVQDPNKPKKKLSRFAQERMG